MSNYPSRPSQDEKCIFCLQETPTPSIYQGTCNCHPFVHETCIHDWYRLHNETCPICLKTIVKHSDIITLYTNPRYRDRYRLVIVNIGSCCCFYASCICVYSIPTILLILFTIYFLVNIDKHISRNSINSTNITTNTNITMY